MNRMGAEVNAQDDSRRTPLLRGLLFERFEAAHLLVEHGANIDAKDDSGRTAFRVASEKKYRDFLSDRCSG